MFCEGYDYLQMNFFNSQTSDAVRIKSDKHFSRNLFDDVLETIIHIAMRWASASCWVSNNFLV